MKRLLSLCMGIVFCIFIGYFMSGCGVKDYDFYEYHTYISNETDSQLVVVIKAHYYLDAQQKYDTTFHMASQSIVELPDMHTPYYVIHYIQLQSTEGYLIREFIGGDIVWKEEHEFVSLEKPAWLDISYKTFIITPDMVVADNSDNTLTVYENTPRVAEAILDVPVEDATCYLETQGFSFDSKAGSTDEYLFTKNTSLLECSYNASIMLMFGTDRGAVSYVTAVQRMETEESAYDLYWKWTQYTASIRLPEISVWNSDIIVKDISGSQMLSKWTTYTDGSYVKKVLDDRTEDYKNGTITKEQYDMYVSTYTHGRECFTEDYKREKGNIDSVSEHYVNDDGNKSPKEINMYMYMNNGGHIELHYETHNFIVHWI